MNLNKKAIFLTLLFGFSLGQQMPLQAGYAKKGAAVVKTIFGSILTLKAGIITFGGLAATTGLTLFHCASPIMKDKFINDLFRGSSDIHEITDFATTSSLPLAVLTGTLTVAAAYCTHKLAKYTAKQVDAITE